VPGSSGKDSCVGLGNRLCNVGAVFGLVTVGFVGAMLADKPFLNSIKRVVAYASSSKTAHLF